MFEFITRRSFFFNLLAAGLVVALLLFLFFQSLNFWTHHGEYLKIPDVKGRSMSDAVKLLEQKGFEVMVQDSVYLDTVAPLTIIKQFPDPDATVKVNRTVYLTVTRALAPIIEMPNLVGMTFRNAELEMKTRGLKLGDTTYRPDIAKNAVLEQRVNGAIIKPGDKITMGSTISLVLGAGLGSIDMPVPDLFGMAYGEAKALMEASGIMQGVVLADPGVIDTASAYIFRQSPERFDTEGKVNRIRPGQMIDIWIGLNKPERTIPVSDSSNAGGNEY